MSVFDWDLLDPTVRRFVGFGNYAEMFGGEGIVGLATLAGIVGAAARGALPRRTAAVACVGLVMVFGGLLGLQPGPPQRLIRPLVWGSFGNTLLLVLYSTPVIVGVSLLLALVFNGAGRVAAVMRVLSFAPYVLSVAVLALIGLRAAIARGRPPWRDSNASTTSPWCHGRGEHGIGHEDHAVTTPVDPVIAAIQQAVAADPDSIHLRAHLVELHLRSAASAAAPDDEHVLEARRQLGELLVRAPDHPTVVDLLASSGPLVDPTAWRAPTDGQVPASGTQRGLSAAGGPGPGDGDGMPLDSLEARPGQGSGGDPTDWSRPDITLIDVAGMHDVKERLEVAVFGPARRPELAAAFGRLGRGGLMLWGPPGCGKTFLARAVAGHLGVSFGSVGIEAVLDRWLGSSERNLAALFRAAREDQPCVLFLDEVDAIGQRRSRLRSEHLRTVMSQLLVELDGVDRDNTGVFVIAATNLPWDVDPALRRPGRFDRTVFVPPPDATARAQILVDRLADVPLGEVDVPAIVARTEAFSGADMAHVGDTAAELALAASIASDDVVPVDQAHLREAVDQVAPSIADWIASARNAATWSDDDALFAPFTDWLAGWDKRR